MSMPRRPYLTTRAHEVFALAHDLADRLGHAEPTPTHLALGLLAEGRSVAVAALQVRAVPLEVLSRELEAQLPPAAAPRTPAPTRAWTPTDQRLLAQAEAEARDLGTEHSSCEHLLLALLRDAESVPTRALARHGVGFSDVQATVRSIYAGQLGAPPPTSPAG
jgi:ATP-dependent Clp protease ATP-binding subunit ClpC